MKEIKLTKEKVTIVDDCDYQRLSKFKWQARQNQSGIWYASRQSKGKTFRMHRFLLNIPIGFQPDHINGDGLDNRQCNLRIATRSQNNANCRVYKNSPSGFKGIQWYSKKKKWRAQISKEYKRYSLGYFHNLTDACQAYNEEAKILFGNYAKLNEI